MRLRGKSIRRKIVALLLVPLLSLASLWAFATVITLKDARHILGHSSVMQEIGHPTESAIEALQRERRQVMVYLADPRRSDALSDLHRQQRITDEALNTVRDRAGDGDVDGELPFGHRSELIAVLDGLDSLHRLRLQVEENTITRGDAFRAYNGVVDPSHHFLDSLHMLENAELDAHGHALVGVAAAREYLAREDALLAGVLAAGRMKERELRAFADRVAERKLAYRTYLTSLSDEDQRGIEKIWDDPDGRTLRKTEEAVIAMGAAQVLDATNPDLWETVSGRVLDDLAEENREASARYHERVEPAASEMLTRVVVAGVLGFIALVISLFISLRVGRGLVRDLSALRKEAHESSAIRLPSVMRRLAAGDEVEVEVEAPQLTYGQDEMGQVGQALNTLQRSAVEAAVKQSELRKGVSEVFVNLARRNQVLLHRQLTLLDTMERRTEDADELADLFRLDHLTTRMRRHAEGLVILSGAVPSRQWRKPVQLMDVVRAAVAEVEDYERVEVRRLPRLAVDGPAVPDLTHLLAELIENATVFSPPHSAVQVLGERVSNGFTLEIHDRGLGMHADALLEANLRLAETPEFELSDTDRLGLFVVSRLAQRQGVRVSLQPSPFGGTTAVVLIPGAILTETSRSGDRDGADEDTSETLFAALAQRPTASDRALALEASAVDGGRDERDGAVTPREGARGQDAPAEQHQQAPDDAGPGTAPKPARPTGLPPLPRRTPVLVSDHGRTIDLKRHTDDASPQGSDARRSEVAGGRRDGSSTTASGLPRRVRQASLAPQLRSDSDQDGTASDGADRSSGDAPPRTGGSDTDVTGLGDRAPWQDRDAEEVRSRMAAVQQGWRRGREQRERQDTTDPGTGSGDAAAPGTTLEGDGR